MVTKGRLKEFIWHRIHPNDLWQGFINAMEKIDFEEEDDKIKLLA